MRFGRSTLAAWIGLITALESGAQSVTLVPSRSAVFNSYSLGEWIVQASGSGWVSYDRIQGEVPFTAVLVNGLPLSAAWNGNAWYGLPNWALSDIDSVVVHEPGSIVNGFAVPDGAIDIHPRFGSGLTVDVGAVNATRDPGILIGTSYETPNVERIRQYGHLIWGRDSGLTRVDITSQSYIGGIGLDGRPYRGFIDRNFDPSDTDLYPYQTRVSVTNIGQWVKGTRRTRHVTQLLVDPQQFIWDAGQGREAAIRTITGQFSLSNRWTDGQAWQWEVHGSRVRYDTLRFAPTGAEPEETSTQARLGYMADRWEASLLGSHRGGGVGAGVKGRWWRADAVLESHQQLVSIRLTQARVRTHAVMVFDRFHRIRMDVPFGFGATYHSQWTKPENPVISLDWRTGVTMRNHRLDAVAAIRAAGEADPRFSRFIARGAWRWQANETFGMAVSASYRSARRFEGALFPEVPAHTDIGLNLHQTFFRNRLRLDLNLRNMLDRMDTDHPDGVIHPMSVEYRVRLML